MQLFILVGIILLLIAFIIYQTQSFERSAILSGSKKIWLWIEHQKVGPYTAHEIAAKLESGEVVSDMQFFFDGSDKLRTLEELSWIRKHIVPSAYARIEPAPSIIQPTKAVANGQAIVVIISSVGLLGIGLGILGAIYFSFFFDIFREGTIDIARVNDRTLGFVASMVSILAGAIFLAAAVIRQAKSCGAREGT